MPELYYIENIGCDDITCGLAIISDEMLPLFKSFIDNLNKNSQYSCMPVIEVYKIDESFVRLATENDQPDKILHMTGGDYVLSKSIEFYDRDADKIKLREGIERIC